MTGAAVTVAAPPAAALPSRLAFNLGLAPNVHPDQVVDQLDLDLAGGLEWIPGLRAVRADLEFDDYTTLWNKLQAAKPELLRYAEREQIVELNGSGSWPLTGREAQTVQLPRARSGSEPVTVAVLDTGVTANRDLPADRLVGGIDATRLPLVMLPDQPDLGKDTADEAGFGTMAAGIIAGASGLCTSCRIMPVKVANEYRGELISLSADLAAGIVWAADHGAQIITTPAVVQSNTNLIAEAVAHAQDKGVLIIASAGQNTSNNRPVFPAAAENALAVSGVDTSGRLTGRSNYYTGHDRWIDVAAAEGAPATNHLGERKQLDGVEGATATVAGVAALAFASKPGAKADDVRKAIVGTTAAGALPVLNAGKALHQLVGGDSADPEITATGLTTDQLVTKPIDVRPAVTDDFGVDRVELTVSGKIVATSRTPWQTLRFTPPAGFSGRLALSFKATDHAGKTDGATTVVVVDTAGPTGSIVSPVSGAHVRGAAKVVFRGAVDVASAKVNGVRMTKSGTDWIASAAPSRNQLVVEAADQHGNVTRFTRTVVADNAGPTATAVNPKQNTRVRGTFTTSVSGVKDVAGLAKAELWVDGKYAGSGTSRKVSTGKKSGNVKLVWKLTDKVGNSRTYTRTVIADNKAPSVSITKAPKNKAKVKGTVKVYVKAADTSGVARVELLVNGKVVSTDVKSGYVLSVNTKKQKKTMKVRVRAYDKLGNVAYTSTRTWRR
jgi:hypothetical protein